MDKVDKQVAWYVSDQYFKDFDYDTFRSLKKGGRSLEFLMHILL